ncbi:MAG: DUF805 domain-containing protein [Pseudomonadota bacterium]
MTFPAAIRTCLRKFVTFSGRASRPEFWWFAPPALVFAGVATVLGLEQILPVLEPVMPEIFVLILGFVLLGWPVWPAASRRLQDAGFAARPVLWLLALIGIGTLYFAATATCSELTGCSDSWVGRALGLLLLLGPAFMGFILGPILCLGLIFTMATRPSELGPNQYGPNPHEVTP